MWNASLNNKDVKKHTPNKQASFVWTAGKSVHLRYTSLIAVSFAAAVFESRNKGSPEE